MGGRWVGFPEGLCNFWVEQLTATQNYAISGLSSPAGLDCIVFPVKLDRKNYAILETNELPIRIVQFLEGRLVPL